MSIKLIPFEGIESADISHYIKENPLYGFEIKEGLFDNKSVSIFDLPYDIDIQTWKINLSNKISKVIRNFGYAMFYYNKGVSDKTSNFYNFTYFVDVFFLYASALYETVGHLLVKTYKLKLRGLVSFNSAIIGLKEVNSDLYNDLNKIKESSEYEKGNEMRNNIVHNHPPYEKSSGVSKHKGIIAVGKGTYVTPEKIKEVMIGFSESIKKTLLILEKYL